MKILSGRRALGERLKEIRIECFGADGLEALALLVGVHARTWRNYEEGVTITGIELLKFIVQAQVNPAWLLTGEGNRFYPPQISVEPRDE